MLVDKIAGYYFIFIAVLLFPGGTVFFISRRKIFSNSKLAIGTIEKNEKLA